MCLLCVCSFFGRAFEKAAESTNSRTLHNYFDLSGKNLMNGGLSFKVIAGCGTRGAGIVRGTLPVALSACWN